MQTRRERFHEATSTEIKNMALTQMAEQGAASLSLRAIAIQMGMSSQSLYNYYSCRNQLVTALIVDAYTCLAEELEKVSYSLPTAHYGKRFLAVSLAFRRWALTHREQFILIYGTPIPAYHAPTEVTTPVAIRATNQFMAILEAAWIANQISLASEYSTLNTPTHQHIRQLFANRGSQMPPPLLHLALAGWYMIHGAVSLELYGHMDYLGCDIQEVFREEILAYLHRLGITLSG